MMPLHKNDDGTFTPYMPCDPVEQSFTWCQLSGAVLFGLKPIATFESTHSYGAPSFFKPSVSEVLASAPQTWNDAVGFTIEPGGQGFPPDCFTPDGSKHRAVVTVWATEESDSPTIKVTQEKQPASLGDFVYLAEAVTVYVREDGGIVTPGSVEMAIIRAVSDLDLIVYRK